MFLRFIKTIDLEVQIAEISFDIRKVRAMLSLNQSGNWPPHIQSERGLCNHYESATLRDSLIDLQERCDRNL